MAEITYWHHSPLHRFEESGTFMVTAGTYGRLPHLSTPERRDLVRDRLFELAEAAGWELQAWAIMANHYHFIGVNHRDPESLSPLIRKLHSLSAREINRMDGRAGRKVWHQYWDTRLSFENSFYPRLRYVHENPVHHGVIGVARNYPWCSARWFEEKAEKSLVSKVRSYGIERLKVKDDF